MTQRRKERCISFDSYIKPQQDGAEVYKNISCISFDSYIKPQLSNQPRGVREGCISFDSYIKPQQSLGVGLLGGVVYLLIPTSNHNHVETFIA